jgi:hypothetical protein
MLGEVTREMLFWSGSAVAETDVVTVILLVSASHCATVWLVIVKYQEPLLRDVLRSPSAKH